MTRPHDPAPRVACEESAHAKTDGPRHAPPRKPTAGEWVGLALILVITSPITFGAGQPKAPENNCYFPVLLTQDKGFVAPNGSRPTCL